MNIRILLAPAAVALAWHFVSAPLAAAPADDAQQILQTSGVKGGIVVQLGLGDAALTRALRANDSYQVIALDADAKKVAAAREAIFDAGKYGPVSVQEFSGAQLPFIDNLVNLLVAENLGAVPQAEALRVLVPNGVPEPIVKRLNEAFNEATMDPVVKRKLADMGLNATATSPTQFTQVIREEVQRYKKMSQSISLK